MKVGCKIKRKGEIYTVYKVLEHKCFAEDQYGINIICIPNLKRVK